MTRLLIFFDVHLEHRPAWRRPETVPPFEVAVVASDVDVSPEHRIGGASHRARHEQGAD